MMMMLMMMMMMIMMMMWMMIDDVKDDEDADDDRDAADDEKKQCKFIGFSFVSSTSQDSKRFQHMRRLTAQGLQALFQNSPKNFMLFLAEKY